MPTNLELALYRWWLFPISLVISIAVFAVIAYRKKHSQKEEAAGTEK